MIKKETLLKFFLLALCVIVVCFIYTDLKNYKYEESKHIGSMTTTEIHSLTIAKNQIVEILPVETEPPIPTLEDIYTDEFEATWRESAIYMAKTIYGEARGDTEEGQRKVGWCILNRVDDPRFDDTIIDVITAPSQFHGYVESFPCTLEFYELSMNIIANWQLEKVGGESNRNLPSDYFYFHANGQGGNTFKQHWR